MSYRFVEPLTRVGGSIPGFGGATLSFFEFNTSTPKETFSDFALTVPNTDPVVANVDGLFGDIYLDIQADVTLKSSSGLIIYGPENIFAPEDTITALAASAVSVLDTAGNFDQSTVESVLAEISDDWLKLDRTNTMTAVQTIDNALQMLDNEVRRALLIDYAISHSSASSTSGTLTLDLVNGNSFVTTLTENITTINISNPPGAGRYGEFVIKIIQDNAAGAFTVAWPSSVKWPGGTAPIITTSNGAIDAITLSTIDAGSEWLGSFSQAYS